MALLLKGLAAAHRCVAEIDVAGNYPVTFNDLGETDRVLDCLKGLYGQERVEVLSTPGMASEDFSYMLEEVPGNMFFLGVQADQSLGTAMYSATAVFDDSLLGEQAATPAELAWRRLSAEKQDSVR
jgi:metal-dependent amidase/aminoacylase/carboxypeptidase family protein